MPESILFLCGQESKIEREFLDELLRYYQSGTKIVGIFSNKSQVISVVEVLDGYLSGQGLARDGLGLAPASFGSEIEMDGTHFLMYHGSFHLWTLPCPMERKIITAEQIGSVLPVLEKYALTFDVAQFCAIEEGQGHNILVEGVGGTGKTSVLLARFLFLWKNTELEEEVFLKSTKILVFHVSLKEEYREWVRKELENNFLLTGNEKYGRMLTAVHKIQLYTMDELLREALWEGGEKLEIVDDVDLLKEIISQTTQLFIVESPEKISEMQEMNLTFSEIEAHIFRLVMKLYEEKLDLQSITAASFGAVKKSDPYGGMKLFYHESAIKIAHLWKETLISMRELHYMQVTSHFLSIDFHCGQETFLLIDDFDLAKDGEVEAIFSYAKKKETWLFICQNRGETKFSNRKNSFFQCFFTGNQVNAWYFFILKHQYRMDKQLCQIFQNIFTGPNQMMGLKNFNEYLWDYPSKFYHMSKIYHQDDVMIGIYDEIKRVERRFYYEKAHGMKQQEQMATFAIIVDSIEKVIEIVSEFGKYGQKIHSFSGENLVLRDLKCLIRAILCYDDACALSQLLESNFFAVSVPKSNLYRISQEESQENGVVLYLKELLSKEFEKNQEKKLSWDSLQEKLFYNLDYLKYFYEIMAPWERCDKTEKKKYQQNLEELFSYIEKEGILTLSSLECELISEKMKFSPEKLEKEDKLQLFCFTKEECVGREFGHILLLCSNERKNKENDILIDCTSSFFAYEFPLKWENTVLSNEFLSEVKQKSVEKQIGFLYQLMSKSQYSFSWLSVGENQKTIEEGILEKGLDTYGI